jgi:hypothetical protein
MARQVLGLNFPVRCLKIAWAIATIWASRFPSALANCAGRTSSAARNGASPD